MLYTAILMLLKELLFLSKMEKQGKDLIITKKSLFEKNYFQDTRHQIIKKNDTSGMGYK